MPEDQMNILERVHNAYHNLTAAERKVADYVLETGTAVQFMSITQLAEECGVADATVPVFAAHWNCRASTPLRSPWQSFPAPALLPKVI